MVIMRQSYILGGKNEANGNNLLMHVFIFPLSIGAGWSALCRVPHAS